MLVYIHIYVYIKVQNESPSVISYVVRSLVRSACHYIIFLSLVVLLVIHSFKLTY
jgi:hypothetical protein